MPHKCPIEKRASRRRWWAALPKERKDARGAQDNRRITVLRAYIAQIKMQRGCIDCGYKEHAAALDFDHVHGPKTILVSFCKSKAQADREIKKCEVRCANCHRVKSWERRWGGIPA